MSEQFTESLRRFLREAPISRYAIGKSTGIDEGVLSKFVHGTRGLSMESLDLLIDALGLELRPREPRTKKRGK